MIIKTNRNNNYSNSFIVFDFIQFYTSDQLYGWIYRSVHQKIVPVQNGFIATQGTIRIMIQVYSTEICRQNMCLRSKDKGM